MNVIYALEPIPKSIFLAGPTPRPPKPGQDKVPSWRPEAVRMLRDDLGFTGSVFVPESPDGEPHDNYDHQLPWEWEGLNQATIVAFWIPRVLETMPAMTTNVEFGMLVNSGKMVLGAPPEAAKMTYLKELAKRYNVCIFDNLHDTLQESVIRTRQLYGRFGAQA